MTKKVLREQRRLKAQHYRQLYLLPRYVQEEGGKRKLEAGEFDPKSELYPLSTPIDQLSDFGEFLSSLASHASTCLCNVMVHRQQRSLIVNGCSTLSSIIFRVQLACHFTFDGAD